MQDIFISFLTRSEDETLKNVESASVATACSQHLRLISLELSQQSVHCQCNEMQVIQGVKVLIRRLSCNNIRPFHLSLSEFQYLQASLQKLPITIPKAFVLTFARYDFPVPGGPYKRMPLQGFLFPASVGLAQLVTLI